VVEDELLAKYSKRLVLALLQGLNPGDPDLNEFPRDLVLEALNWLKAKPRPYVIQLKPHELTTQGVVHARHERRALTRRGELLFQALQRELSG